LFDVTINVATTVLVQFTFAHMCDVYEEATSGYPPTGGPASCIIFSNGLEIICN